MAVILRFFVEYIYITDCREQIFQVAGKIMFYGSFFYLFRKNMKWTNNGIIMDLYKLWTHREHLVWVWKWLLLIYTFYTFKSESHFKLNDGLRGYYGQIKSHRHISHFHRCIMWISIFVGIFFFNYYLKYEIYYHKPVFIKFRGGTNRAV